MTIKQKKSQSVGYGLVLLFATLAMAAFAVFDVASLPHKLCFLCLSVHLRLQKFGM